MKCGTLSKSKQSREEIRRCRNPIRRHHGPAQQRGLQRCGARGEQNDIGGGDGSGRIAIGKRHSRRDPFLLERGRKNLPGVIVGHRRDKRNVRDLLGQSLCRRGKYGPQPIHFARPAAGHDGHDTRGIDTQRLTLAGSVKIGWQVIGQRVAHNLRGHVVAIVKLFFETAADKGPYQRRVRFS